MSLLTNISSKIVIGALITVGTIGSVAAIASSNPTISSDITAVKNAITAKDLNSYKSAKTKLVENNLQSQKDKINSTTQDELNSMSDKLAKRDAVQTAIKNNDYAAFKANADSRMLDKVNSQAEFDILVEDAKTRSEELTKLDEAIKNNDLDSFKTIIKNREANKPTDNHKMKFDRPALSDDQLKTKFDEMVTNYKNNGTLPSQAMEDKGMMKRGFEGGKHRKGMK